MRKMFVSMTAIALIGVLAACNQNDESDEDKKETVTPVETVKATTGDLVVEKSLYGRTAPVSTMPVTLQNPGEITELEVENGEMVEEDDLIAIIKTARGNQNIYASKDGEIANLNAEEGAMVSNSEPLAVIADFDTMKLNFTLAAGTLDLFEKEDTFTALIDDKEYDAEITSIGSMPDDTGLFPVEATIENKDDAVLAGMVAVMKVPEKRVKDTVIVPTAAIVDESGETFIYVIEDEKAIKKEVSIKESQSNETAIEGEVNDGAQVVTNGQLTLTDESKVNVVKEGE
ncbi:efflux RND transporter periplasmic adaptor subunit [Virgibacillus litoralis]|uniref:Multidrug efflux pump subunit AcrA (Membrane-fusion protein) n=1 Tax=Virgibacillus litoralis TaxID=578221 RepID=A0ABS4HD19_9BACI|nr:efflux RND transporter periplasmic adaptor subunit [Virgibacillus litoralis]MBP1948810.1 multidrug efflux pump subunit AcrA (membrane-fusion protein) [Virgibacillus litoralis]